jgi:hypothetical protein
MPFLCKKNNTETREDTKAILKTKIMSCIDNITEKEKDEFAIGFANWLSNLSPSEKISVWSKNGEHSGLFTMDNEQLLDKYKRK